jgi:hypothetical protein
MYIFWASVSNCEPQKNKKKQIFSNRPSRAVYTSDRSATYYLIDDYFLTIFPHSSQDCHHSPPDLNRKTLENKNIEYLLWFVFWQVRGGQIKMVSEGGGGVIIIQLAQFSSENAHKSPWKVVNNNHNEMESSRERRLRKVSPFPLALLFLIIRVLKVYTTSYDDEAI